MDSGAEVCKGVQHRGLGPSSRTRTAPNSAPEDRRVQFGFRSIPSVRAHRRHIRGGRRVRQLVEQLDLERERERKRVVELFLRHAEHLGDFVYK